MIRNEILPYLLGSLLVTIAGIAVVAAAFAS